MTSIHLPEDWRQPEWEGLLLRPKVRRYWPSAFRQKPYSSDDDIREIQAIYEQKVFPIFRQSECEIMEEDRLKLVMLYLSWAGGNNRDYWDLIQSGTIFGFSIWLHEWAELEAYRCMGADPFNQEEQDFHYKVCHSEALRKECHFWQSIAESKQEDLQFRELFVYNPCTNVFDETLLLDETQSQEDLDWEVAQKVHTFYQECGCPEKWTKHWYEQRGGGNR